MKRKTFSVFFILVLLVNLMGIAFANTSDSYYVHYIPGGAPGSVQTDYTYVTYYSGAWVATCSNFQGQNGSHCKITATHSAGITASNGNSYVLITSTGNTVTWTVNGYWTSGAIVTHIVNVQDSLPCIASGLVKYNE